MSRWLARRIGQALITFLLAISLLFVVMRLSPGDPLSRLESDRPLSREAVAALRARYGLDQPILLQFVRFVAGATRGELGTSIERGRPVTTLLRERLPATMLLGGTALVINFTLGIWLGAWQAVRHGSRADRWLSVLTLAAYATPSFWLALVFAWSFGTELRILPVAFLHDPCFRLTRAWPPGWSMACGISFSRQPHFRS